MSSRKAFGSPRTIGYTVSAIAEPNRALNASTKILDGEAVVLDERGRSDFSLFRQGGHHRQAS
jgi:ATP-dependent DNA ligase